MKITRGYKTELDLNNKQKTACLQHAGTARYAYNWALAIKIFSDAIQLPRLGKLRLKEHDYLPLNAHILTATVSEQAGRWFVSIQVEGEQAQQANTATTAIGIDLGVHTLATCSDGSTYPNPRSLKHKLKKLKRLQRAHSRKQKGSKSREQSRKKLAVLHAHIANIRKDALHKFTTIVCKNHAHIAIEDLYVAGMLKNHHVAQAIADTSMGEIKRQLQYKAKKFGTRVVAIDRFYPSSKTCSSCGWINEELDLSKRVFVCIECGYLTDRDYNAAKNILAVSLTDSLNAYGAASSGSLVTMSETSRVEAGT